MEKHLDDFIRFLVGIDNLNEVVFVAGLLLTAAIVLTYFTTFRSRQMLNYVPNVWTSLGILGTFVSIVGSLSMIKATSYDLKDSTVVLELIEKIGPAFTTSIIGIIGAIITSILIKVIYAVEERREDKAYVKAVGADVSPEIMLNKVNLALERLINVTQVQESNIRKFLNAFLSKLDEFYVKVYDANKEQVRVLSEEYVDSVAAMLERASESAGKRVDQLLVSHSELLNGYLKAESEKLDEVAAEVKTFLRGVPESVDTMRKDLLASLKNAVVEQYRQLLESNSKLSEQLLGRFHELEGELSESVIHRIISLMEESLRKSYDSLETVSNELKANIPPLVESIGVSTADNAAVVAQLRQLVPVLEKQAEQTKRSVAFMDGNSESLANMLALLEELAKKNQQLRYELTQWKRVHKKVKINDKTGNKECPNCGAENPIEANYCRECSCGFWECESV